LSAAIDGDRLLITEDREGPVGVYERVGGGWQRVSGFGPGSPHNGIFGDELALGGDYALIGASNGGYAQVPLPQPWGHAFIYELQNDAWVQVVHLLNPDGDSRGFSWRAAGIHGNRAVVGDFGDGLPEGTVHPYVRRTDGTWHAEPILRRQDDHCFGFSADIDADLLVAGTCKSGSFAGTLGSAYVYWRLGDAWVPLHTLEDPTANDTKEFGHVVAAGPDFVLVAAPGEFQSGHVGSVFVYDLVR
jgi:hypothetical protein